MPVERHYDRSAMVFRRLGGVLATAAPLRAPADRFFASLNAAPALRERLELRLGADFG